jgi:ADP-ribose pyrophosphatase
MPFTLQPGSKHAFHGVRFDVWQWEQELFDGSKTTFECITRKDSASVIAFLDPNTVLLTTQDQPGRESSFVDAPGGVIEPDEAPEAAVRREFFEETGYEIGKLELFRRHDMKGASRFSTFIYIASDLKNGRAQTLDAGEKITLRPTPFEEAVRLSLSGGLRQAWVMLDIVSLRYDEESANRLKEFLS